ncbi:hypothetical protein ACOTI8_29620 [Achromobacter xylosoxidans]
MTTPQSRLLKLADEAVADYNAMHAAGGEAVYPSWVEDVRLLCNAAPASPVSTVEEHQPARDWELTCHECDGSGHVYVKHQVAERKTDLQEFKEECECCEGRGFVFAFQDIPGIEEYVKTCRPAPAAPGVSTVEDSSFPSGAIVNGRVLADRLEAYPFESQGGDLRLCSDWVEFRRCFEYLAEWVGSRAPAAGDARPVLPPLNDDLADILGRPNFRCADLAELLRADGKQIKRKSEHEQAAVIHFLLGHYLQHGSDWRETAGSALDAIAAQRKGDA